MVNHQEINMNNDTREQVKSLWKICFDDRDEFIELYFKLRFTQEVNLSICSGKQIISAMQLLPYPFTYYGIELQASYISGACTHPDFRNQGVMHELLSEAFAKMSLNNIDVSILIPAEDWLFDYYKKVGYATVFNYSIKNIEATQPVENGIKIEQVTDFREDTYKYFNRKMHERNCCAQHTKKDIEVIIADMNIGDGFILTASNGSDTMGIAFVYIEDEILYIDELLSDNKNIEQQLIYAVHQVNKNASLKLITPPTPKDSEPLGMVRIINAYHLLQIYAKNHPSLEMNIQLTDSLLSSNNGYYYLHNGKCTTSKDRLNSKHVLYNIHELGNFLFEDINPYMSLMMD